MLHCLLLLNPFISYLSPPLTLSSAPSVLSLPLALPSQGHLGAQGPDGPTGLPGRQGPPGEKVCHTCQQSGPPLALPLSTFCEGGIVMGTCTCRSNIRYSGKISREKTFANFRSFVAIRESFLREIWDMVSFGAAKASNPQKFSTRKSYFLPNHESFLPRKFTTIPYQV